MDYGFIHDGRVFTPNSTTVAAAENDARNRAIETAELTAWAQQPARAVAYFEIPADLQAGPAGRSYGSAQVRVTTWLGTAIGRITFAKVTRHNFGGRLITIRVTGTNGAHYAGRASFDAGTVITLRKVRS